MGETYSGRQLPGMANISVEDAVAYINNEEEQLALISDLATFSSWIKPAIRGAGGKRSKKAKYRKTTFAKKELGTYDRVKGYPDADYTSTWSERDLTQEKGNILTVDDIDGEASIGNDIVFLHNKYTREIKVPEMSKYIYGQVVANAGVKGTTTLTKSNIFATILSQITALREAGYSVEASDLELRITPTTYQLFVEAGYDKGSFSLGGVAFSFTTDVNNAAGVAKIIQVPSSLMGNANYILAPASAISVIFLLDETVYRDSVEGHGTRKKQVEEGMFYDAWINPGYENLVIVNSTAE